MIGHDAFRTLAAWAVDQPVGADDADQLAIHRASCDACRAFDDGLHADAIAIGRHRELLPSSALDRRVEAAIYGARPAGRLSPVAMLLVLAIMLAAATSAVFVAGSWLNRDQVRLPDRPATPDGWISTVASTRDLRVALPPYLEVFSVDGTVYANEAIRADGTIPLGLMAAGAAAAEQPRAGQSLESWLLFFIGSAPHEGYQTRPISLPAGRGLELRVVVLAGTPDVTQVVLYAISTDDGVAFLELTGLPEAFVNHAADLALIPLLLETGPALTAVLPPEPPGFELRLVESPGWLQMTAPVQPADGPVWTTFVSGTAFPADLCGPISDGTLACNLVLSDGAAPGTWLLGVIEVRGGVTRTPVDTPSLPPNTHRATVGGHPAIRTDHFDPVEGIWDFTWEVPSPGEPSGTFVIRMVATAGYVEALAQVEVMLANAEFVARE